MPLQRQLVERAAPPHQRLLLGVHNPVQLLASAQWLPEMLLKQVLAQPAQAQVAPAAGSGPPANDGRTAATLPPQVQLVALSPNVAAYTRSLLEAWAGGMRPGPTPILDVPWLPPLVPWSHSPAAGGSSDGDGSREGGQRGISSSSEHGGSSSSSSGKDGAYRHLCIQVGCPATRNSQLGCLHASCHSQSYHLDPHFFLLQGSIHPTRRDYAAAFAAASHPAVLAQLARGNESLLLVGGLRREEPVPPIPDALRPFVRVIRNLKYKASSGARGLYWNWQPVCGRSCLPPGSQLLAGAERLSPRGG